MDILILCRTCGAVRTISHREEAEHSDAEVLALAGHTPDCAQREHVMRMQSNTPPLRRYEVEVA